MTRSRDPAARPATWTGRPAHPAVGALAADARAGRLDRREFLALATALGTTGAAAWGLLGAPRPAAAEGTPTPGGVLRLSMNVLAVDDPRLFDWSEKANVARQCLEPLVRYARDYTFEPWLLAGWEVSADVRTYTLRVRPGVTWTNGDAFTAADVAYNFARWGDREVAGNSMAGRMPGLLDAATGRLRAGAVEVLDPLTLRLHLSAPDISLIPNLSEYPALIVHPSFDATGANFAANPISTGPFELAALEVGVRAEVRRRADGRWWGGAPLLDGVVWIDHGTDPQSELAAFEAGEIDANYWTTGEFIAAMEALGLKRHSVVTAATVVARMHVGAAPYDDQRVRRGVQLTVDNAKVLQLGFGGRGTVAENHHVCPIHPEYATLPPVAPDRTAARALLEAAGALEFEHELISIDDDYRRNTADAIAAQMRDAGLKVKRTIIPGAEFWDGWTRYPFSTTNWNMRPLGVQALALGYRTGEAWNESGFSDPVFDARLAEALATPDTEARRAIMAELQAILQGSGVIVQSYWQDLYCHSTARVQGYFKHALQEMHLEQVWLAP